MMWFPKLICRTFMRLSYPTLVAEIPCRILSAFSRVKKSYYRTVLSYSIIVHYYRTVRWYSIIEQYYRILVIVFSYSIMILQAIILRAAHTTNNSLLTVAAEGT